MSCDPAPNRIFENRKARGARSRKRNRPPCFYKLIVSCACGRQTSLVGYPEECPNQVEGLISASGFWQRILTVIFAMVRTLRRVAIPTWVKQGIDVWTTVAGNRPRPGCCARSRRAGRSIATWGGGERLPFPACGGGRGAKILFLFLGLA